MEMATLIIHKNDGKLNIPRWFKDLDVLTHNHTLKHPMNSAVTTKALLFY